MTYCVSAKDRFMSGWGPAEDKVNVLIFACDGREECDDVARNCKARSEFYDVVIHTEIPHFDEDDFYVEYKDRESSERFYSSVTPW